MWKSERRSVVVGGVVLGFVLALVGVSDDAAACCPAPPSGRPVVNADQTVALLWDPATKTEHFVRRASFKGDADDFGFLVPTPAQPELDESGDAAFPVLADITKPEIVYERRPTQLCSGCLRSASKASASAPAQVPEVVVLEEKTVAGFHAAVLEATNATALVAWLKEHGYAFSPEVEAWAKPYVDGGWKITALQVAKPKSDAGAAPPSAEPRPPSAGEPSVAAAALRISFKTERPLFPYREPDTTKAASDLGAAGRMLRIYLVSDARYDGKLGMKPETASEPWPTSTVAWSGKLDAAARSNVLANLKLPDAALPKDAWLTEFEDRWPYRVAPGDLWFSKAASQTNVRREPTVIYTYAPRSEMPFALSTIALAPLAWRLRRRSRGDAQRTTK